MTDIKLSSDEVSRLQTSLSLALGQVRTEYIENDDIFSMFSMPVYLGELVGVRPCLLVGGRGTGKTTTLRSLTYLGQFRLSGPDITQWSAVGGYWRIESNVVTAFKAKGIDEETWIRIFSHYVNLQMLKTFLGFITWRTKTLGISTEFSNKSLLLTSVALNLPGPLTLGELVDEVDLLIALLEARMNGGQQKLLETDLSALGKPIEYLLSGISDDDPLKGKAFAFCIDEYENLEPFQQRVINTLIKHVGDAPYTFKIGIRDSGWRERSTLVANQPLVDPADYTTVDIVRHLKEQSFSDFAAKVCEMRLQRMDGLVGSPPKMTSLFPGLSEEAEAIELGARTQISKIRRKLVEAGATSVELGQFDHMAVLEACLVGFWAEGQKDQNELAVLRFAADSPQAWRTRLGNYSYALLFALRGGKRGIRKYYSGWSTLTQMADGNIRYVLRLVYESLLLHTGDGQGLAAEVAPKDQTLAAQKVGEKSLRELQGLSERGGQITRLTLSLGRIFQVLALDPHGHTPEVNQFRVERSGLVSDVQELDQILRDSVTHGSLLAFAGDKQARVSGATKEFDYQLHPIFAAYFTFSFRRKRRLTLRADDVLGLASENPANIIVRILGKRQSRTEDLPPQLWMYSELLNESD